MFALLGLSCNSQSAPEPNPNTGGSEIAQADPRESGTTDGREQLPAKLPEKRKTPDGVVVTQKNGNVENGSAYDKATIELDNYTQVVIPDDAVVRYGSEPKKLQIHMKKMLGFAGHPPEAMSIKQARNHMGCAIQVEKAALVIATFGEWDSHIEGGASMKVVFVVPKGVEVEKRAKLSGEDSVCSRAWEGGLLTKPAEVKEGYWYGPASPGQGWKAIKAVPDLERPVVCVEIGASEETVVDALTRRGVAFKKSAGEGVTRYAFSDGVFGRHIIIVQNGRITRIMSL